MYIPIDSVRSLIRQFYHIAEAHASRETDTDLLVAYTIHAMNLERLLSIEYVTMGEAGLISPFLRHPTMREKCEGVVEGLRASGLRYEAITTERLSILIPTAGVIKHALCPAISGLRQKAVWARDASLALFRHYFDEEMLVTLPPAA